MDRCPAPAEKQGSEFSLRQAESQEPRRQQVEMPRRGWTEGLDLCREDQAGERMNKAWEQVAIEVRRAGGLPEP